MTSNILFDESILPEGTILNNGCYRILRKLGQGGFGITYLAAQLGYMEDIGENHTVFRKSNSNEEVIIKELFYKDFCERRDNKTVTIYEPNRRAVFLKMVNKLVSEGLILRQLQHPNIVNNRKIFRENDTAYIVMDYLQGDDLEVILGREKTIATDKAIKYTKQIASALQHVHQQKILHLDVKPSNVFIRNKVKVVKGDGTVEYQADDTAILIDFGASLTYDDQENVIRNTNSSLLNFMSVYTPIEQTNRDLLDKFEPRLDIFALTGTFYHCITGHLPKSPGHRAASDPDPLELPSKNAEINPNIALLLDQICIKGLKLRLVERYPDISQMLKDLNEVEIMLQRKIEFKNTVDVQSVVANKEPDNSQIQAEQTKVLNLNTPPVQKEVYKNHYNLALAALKEKKYARAKYEIQLALTIRPKEKELIALRRKISRKHVFYFLIRICLFSIGAMILVLALSYYADSLVNKRFKQFDTVSSRRGEGLIAVKKGEKIGFADEEGHLIIPCDYDNLTFGAFGSGGHFSEGLIGIGKSGKWGVIDKQGNTVVDFQYRFVGTFAEGLAPVILDSKWGFIDHEGNVKIPLQYEGADSFSEGLACVTRNGKDGYINPAGEMVIPAIYDVGAGYFSDGIALVALNGKEYYIDKNGQYVKDKEK